MSRTIRFISISLLLVAALALSFGIGYNLGKRTSPDLDQGLDKVEQVWNIIFQDYVDKDHLDRGTLSQAAIRGMLKALNDPYTSYLDVESYQLGLSSLEGEIDGIGADVTIRDEQLTVIAPIADSPADKAGIRAGDIILEIDGVPTSGMSLAEAVLNMRGPAGTTVRLRILHQGETIKRWEAVEEIEVVRSKIELPTVRFEMKGDVGYINITYFSERTNKEVSAALESIIAKGARGIILDLRHNSGGSLQAVTDVTSHFLTEGVVVNMVDSQGKHTPVEVRSGSVTTDLPMVVLVDSFTASGGEVLAGALQDYARATIGGSKTFGKGSVNILRQLKDGSGLFITTARWLTPSGRLIEGKGIEPHYESKLKGNEAVQWAIDYLKGYRK